MTWQKGQSGNPNGKPPKREQFAPLLRSVGNLRRQINGKPIAQKRILAQLMWEAATTGCVTYTDEEGIERREYLSRAEWIAICKLLIDRIDGPVSQAIDMTTAGEPLGSNVVFYLPDNGRDGTD